MIKGKEDFINDRIQDLETALAVLKRIRDNPDESERRCITEAGMDYIKFRRIVFDADFYTKKSKTISVKKNDPFADAPATLCWQELLWCDAMGRAFDTGAAPLDVKETIDFILDDIAVKNPRMVDIVTQYYRDDMSYEDVGKMFDIGPERTRQIVCKCLRLIRCRGKWLQCGKEHVFNTLKLERQLLEDIELNVRREVLNEINANIPPLKTIIQQATKKVCEKQNENSDLNKQIESLNFSVRTINGLHHAGVYTIYDLVERTDHDLMKIRNIGRKSLDEIGAELYRLGYRDTPEITDEDEAI